MSDESEDIFLTESLANEAARTFSMAPIIVTGVNLALGGSFSFLWSAIYTIQLISFLPLANIRTPSFMVHFLAKTNYFDFYLG
jgi:hypothetical protein